MMHSLQWRTWTCQVLQYLSTRNFLLYGLCSNMFSSMKVSHRLHEFCWYSIDFTPKHTHTHTYTHKQLTGTNILKHTYMLTPAVVCSQQLYEFSLCVRFSLVLFFKNCSVVEVTCLLIRFKKAYSFWKHKADWKKRCKWVKIFERVI